MAKFLDKTGMKIGRLTVIKLHSKTPKSTMWLCQCECGRQCVVSTKNLRIGHTESCGCLAKEVLKENSQKQKKPYRDTKLYKKWLHIKNRCNRQNKPSSKYYYEKNIRMCDEWLNDFEAFYKWAIDNGYKEGLTIDRMDNSKSYSPDNCRWADYTVQANNRTNNRRIEYKGSVHTLAEWARILDINENKLRNRMKLGWDIERAFTTP